MSRAELSLATVNRAPAEPMFRVLAQVVAPMLRLFTRQDWRAGDKLPRTGPVIVVANHISNFDPIALGHFLIWHGRWPRTLAKSELWHLPVIGWLARSLGQIPVERRTVRARTRASPRRSRASRCAATACRPPPPRPPRRSTASRPPRPAPRI